MASAKRSGNSAAMMFGRTGPNPKPGQRRLPILRSRPYKGRYRRRPSREGLAAADRSPEKKAACVVP